MLLKNPWAVEIDATNGYPTAEARRVQLPNPASFLAQKALIHYKRDRIDRAKDVQMFCTYTTLSRPLVGRR